MTSSFDFWPHYCSDYLPCPVVLDYSMPNSTSPYHSRRTLSYSFIQGQFILSSSCRWNTWVSTNTYHTHATNIIQYKCNLHIPSYMQSTFSMCLYVSVAWPVLMDFTLLMYLYIAEEFLYLVILLWIRYSSCSYSLHTPIL